jgi:aspartate/methionine/tyrosine aminotransferase
VIPFSLEDFFDVYQHQPGLINLASSEAQPWSMAELRQFGISFTELPVTLAYPDFNAGLLPGLQRLCHPPVGTSLLPTSGAAEAIAVVIHEFSATRTAVAASTVGIPAPGYGAFRGLASLLRLEVQTYDYHPTHDWAPDHEEVLALARHCDLFIVINPHNPSGRLMSPCLLRRIADELAAHDGMLVVDEVFRVPGEGESALGLRSNMIVIGSLSKTYGLPGLRLGWVAAPEHRLPALRTAQQYLTSTPNAYTVAIGAAALKSPAQFSRAKLIRANRELVRGWAQAREDIVRISIPEGGTTICIAVDTPLQEQHLFHHFLDRGILLVPGAQCFGFATHLRWFRLGYGLETSKLAEGLERLGGALIAIRNGRESAAR